MRDLYWVKTGWDLREETVEACASRYARMLNDLRIIHPDFQTLRWSGTGQQVATRDLFELCRNGDLLRLFKKLRVHNVGRTRIVGDGYQLDARSDTGSTHSLLLHLHAGTGSEDGDRSWLPNELSLTVILGGEVDAAVEMLLALKPTLFAMVDAWNVDWGGLFSTSRQAQTVDRPRSVFAGAWAVYLSERFARRVVPPVEVIVERRANGSLFMSASKDVFDANNPAEAAAADAIDASLAPLRGLPRD